MSVAMETIQAIRALRAENRNPRLPSVVAKSVETIKKMVHVSGEQGNGGRVQWRGSAPQPQSQPQRQSQSRQGYAPPSHANDSRRGPRPSTAGSAMGSAQASPFQHRHRAPSAVASVPLTYASGVSIAPVAPVAAKSSSVADTDHGFEVVRRSHRRHEAPAVEFRAPPAKYVSKFKKTSEKVEDTILNTILLGKLNKFSASNYDDIKEFITQIIASGQTEMMSCFMKLVFEKAASEEIFCPLYAKLLSELSAQYPILLQEMASLYAHYMNIFVEVTDEPDKNAQEFLQRNVEKKYRRGYSQFLAELVKHRVIDTGVFVQTVLKIVEQIELNQSNPGVVKMVEELADCLVRMMKAIQSEMMRSESEEKSEESTISQIRSTLKQDVAIRIHPFTVRRPDALGVSNKARFTFMDIYEGIQKYQV